MISSTASPRGQPLLVLVVLLGGWVALRAALWESPFPPARADDEAPRAAAQAVPRVNRAKRPPNAPALHDWALGSPGDPTPHIPVASPWLAMPALDEPPAPDPEVSAEAADPSSSTIMGHQLLTAAALGRKGPPPESAADLASAAPASRSAPALAEASQGAAAKELAGSGGLHRWSADSWLLLRRDSAHALAAGEPSYGRSQAGAVLRYRLAPSSGHRPVMYARATRALAGHAETELAAGFAARPVAGVPVSVAGEMRLYEGAGRRELRPAAFAVTELPPAKFPFGLRGEAYAQAGYVAGRFATAFFDGQARLDGEVSRLGRTGALRAGVGVWAGAQKHTARLDAGPSAALGFRLGSTQSRIAVDYRWRVAGNAQPKSGPALTISAGF